MTTATWQRRRSTGGWQWAQSLSDGPAGTALLHLETGRDAHGPLAAMLASPIAAHPSQTGLFDGAPAVAFTLAATRLRDAHALVDRHVEAITRTRLDLAHRRIEAGAFPDKREFDLISGLTGFAVYLLRRDIPPTSTPVGAGLLGEVLAYLVRLTEPRHDGRPGWWAADGPTGPGPGWSGGHGNLGMAHGIAGVLAVLALALRRGVTVAGQPEAIDTLCRWLDRWRCGTRERPWWPGAITRAEHTAGTAPRPRPGRPSWCYGTPGIARALHLAGLALGDARRQRDAVLALRSCLADNAQLARLSDVSLCHGWAGVLHTAWRAAQHDDQLRDTVPYLADLLRDARRRQPSHHQDGLLTGDAGVQLALHATTGEPPSTRWDAALLLDA